MSALLEGTKNILLDGCALVELTQLYGVCTTKTHYTVGVVLSIQLRCHECQESGDRQQRLLKEVKQYQRGLLYTRTLMQNMIVNLKHVATVHTNVTALNLTSSYQKFVWSGEINSHKYMVYRGTKSDFSFSSVKNSQKANHVCTLYSHA